MNAHNEFERLAVAAVCVGEEMGAEHDCPACKREGLTSQEMMVPDHGADHEAAIQVYGRSICSRQFCRDLMYLEQETAATKPTHSPRVACPKCRGRGSFGSEYHYVRGHSVRNDCPKCDGNGFFSAHQALGML